MADSLGGPTIARERADSYLVRVLPEVIEQEHTSGRDLGFLKVGSVEIGLSQGAQGLEIELAVLNPQTLSPLVVEPLKKLAFAQVQGQPRALNGRRRIA